MLSLQGDADTDKTEILYPVENTKMVTEGQTQRGFKLTDQDVRNAASLILDELLEDRIDKDLRGHRNIRRIRTGPEKEKVYIHTSGSENTVTRSQTLPPNYRELSNVKTKHTDLEESPDKIQQVVNLQNTESSGSSADTEDSPSIISQKRKKKGFLKRASERLRFAFRRNHSKDNRIVKEANSKNNSKQQKGKKNVDKSINESQRHVAANARSRFLDGAQERDKVDKDGTVPAESRSANKWNSHILSSFRRPKKSSEVVGDAKFQKKTGSKAHVHENGRSGVEKPVPGKAVPPSSLQVQSGYPLGVSSLPQRTETPPEDKIDSPKPPTLKSPGYYQSNVGSVASSQVTPLPGESSPSHGNLIVSSSTDFRFHNVVFSTTQSIHSNVLDSPGEDIEFIDAVDTTDRNESSRGSYSKQVQNSTSLYRVHAGFPKSSRPTNLLADCSYFAAEVDPQVVLNPRADGGAEGNTPVAARNLVVLDEADEEIYDEFDGVMDEHESSQSSDQDKEALYCVIAQKLIEMGDSHSASGSDQKSNSADLESRHELDGVMDEHESSPSSDRDKEALYCVIAQRLIEMGDSYSASGSDQKSNSTDLESRQELSPLETDIINCLRSVGDRITRQSKQDTYHRFESTVQNTLQGEISWNHLALLFYATKNVISIVGKGSKAAVLAKDLTVQYVSDSCASWIIDQVGCDILVSSEESDFGVD